LNCGTIVGETPRLESVEGGSIHIGWGGGGTGDENCGIVSQEISAISVAFGSHWSDMGVHFFYFFAYFFILSSLCLFSFVVSLFSFVFFISVFFLAFHINSFT
jgi:hypothetical protein